MLGPNILKMALLSLVVLLTTGWFSKRPPHGRALDLDGNLMGLDMGLDLASLGRCRFGGISLGTG